MLHDNRGIGAMLRMALWCDETLGLEILSVGRCSGLERYECAVEMTGKYLAYSIVLDGGWIFVSTPQSMDSGEEQQTPLFSIGDTSEGWRTTCRFLMAIERSGLTSLKEKPIQIGDGGKDSWLIA